MTDEKFRNKFRIPSARATWHDYNGGMYFVTICTQNREQHFGKIVYDQNNEAQMDYTEIGRFANEQFKTITDHYPYAEIPLWVVMPNHVHCLVVIRNNGAANGYTDNDGNDGGGCGDAINRVSSIADADTSTIENHIGGITGDNNPMLKNCLGAVIRGFKARITHYAHENGIYFQWQTRFHDRIVRDWGELNRIADYIKNNPARWMQDKFYSA